MEKVKDFVGNFEAPDGPDLALGVGIAIGTVKIKVKDFIGWTV